MKTTTSTNQSINHSINQKLPDYQSHLKIRQLAVMGGPYIQWVRAHRAKTPELQGPPSD